MARSQAERLWLIAGGVVGLLLTLIGYFAFIDPQRGETSDVRGQVQSVLDRNASLESRIATLRKQNQQLASFQAQAAQARLELPDTAQLSAFLRTLQQIGGATRTDVTALTAGNPVDVTAAVAPASTTIPQTIPTTSPTDPTAGFNTTQKPHTTSAAGTGPKVYALPIQTTVIGSTSALDDFLTQLQGVQPRAVLITHLTESTGNAQGRTTRPGVTSLALTMYAFVAPGTAAESAALQAAAGR